MTVCSDDSVSVYELQRRSADGEEWKTVRKNVVDFGIQGDFLYASVYKDDHPDTVGFFFFFFCIVSNFNIFLKGFFVCLFFWWFLFVCLQTDAFQFNACWVIWEFPLSTRL